MPPRRAAKCPEPQTGSMWFHLTLRPTGCAQWQSVQEAWLGRGPRGGTWQCPQVPSLYGGQETPEIPQG